uniref:Uncharacterized protein n=1 Tax=Piliocolobus tephrosceles TaxID=591936 RepID=A0A8C9J3X7_9PRIM
MLLQSYSEEMTRAVKIYRGSAAPVWGRQGKRTEMMRMTLRSLFRADLSSHLTMPNPLWSIVGYLSIYIYIQLLYCYLHIFLQILLIS